jgi:hypothetical protein
MDWNSSGKAWNFNHITGCAPITLFLLCFFFFSLMSKREKLEGEKGRKRRA